MKKTTTELTTTNDNIDEHTIALSISQQYAEIFELGSKLVRKVIFFGCALADAEERLRKLGVLVRGPYSEGGFQAWLEKNCPDVKYKTAMRWKSLGVGISKSLSCSPSEASAILTGDAELSNAQLKQRDLILSADSVRELSQVLFDFASEEKGAAGRPAGSKATGEKITRIEAARRLWSALISGVARQREGLYKSAALLPLDEARASLAEVRALVDALNKRCKEGK